MNITRTNQNQPNFRARFYFGNPESKIHLIEKAEEGTIAILQKEIIPTLKNIGDDSVSHSITAAKDNKWHVTTEIKRGSLMTERNTKLSTENKGEPVSIDKIIETANAFEEVSHRLLTDKPEVLKSLNSAEAAKKYTALSKTEGC